MEYNQDLALNQVNITQQQIQEENKEDNEFSEFQQAQQSSSSNRRMPLQQQNLEQIKPDLMDVRQLYNHVLNRKMTLGGTISVVNNIIKLIPELDPSSGDGIHNFSQKQLEQIVVKFIKKVQQYQISQAEFSKEIQGDKTSNKEIYLQELFHKQQIWKQKIQPYYEAKKNSLRDISQILGGDPQSTYTKLYNCFNALGLLTEIIYDKDRHEFQYIYIPDNSGIRGKKVTVSTFKFYINCKTTGFDLGKSILGKNDILYSMIQQIPNKQKLHPNIKQTMEYKYVIKLLQKVELDKRYKRLNKNVQKIISDKKPNNLTVDSAVNKIVGKFKSFGKLKDLPEGRINSQIKVQNNLMSKEGNNSYNLGKLFTKVNPHLQVTEDLQSVGKKYQQKGQQKISDQLVKQLKYLPDNENYLDDIKGSSSRYNNPQEIVARLKNTFDDIFKGKLKNQI